MATGLDAEGRAWVERTLASLTLREKAGQLVFPWVGGEYAAEDSPEMDRLLEWVEREGIGGIVISVGLPHSYAAKLNAVQRRAKVPLLVTTDMESGPGMRLGGGYTLPHLLPLGGGTSFPPVMALGAIGDTALAYEVGRVTAREARAVGVHLNFAPVLDVNSNPLNPIINTRSFGEDPRAVARLATAFLRGEHAGGLMAAGKHFPGHGDTEADTHIGVAAIRADRARLDSVELVPFRAAVAAGVDGMMAAHISVTGVEGPDAPPASLSRRFATDVLRGEMGFGGLVISDAMDMGAIVGRYGRTEPLLMALEAGIDLLLQPLDAREAVDALVAGVESGRISQARLDASVRRILEAKARAGLHRSATADLESVDDVVGTRAHRQLAQTVAERSITLARDERGSVPMAPGARVLSITYADAVDLTAGRWFDRELTRLGHTVGSFRVDPQTPPETYARILALADSADVIVASAYVQPREHAGTVGARGGFPQFVQALATRGDRVVAVSFGSPYVISAYPTAPAYLLAWGGAEVSQRAAARALAGQAAITGRLPVTIPTPDLPRGTGLTREVRR
ncbi:glycoside hydrolase family 3 protein [Longimicrobium sp.]|uniref:glycoside hydrolase family 3 protein n=1 Tax=Longimicrobium sp. TaxID=2029185 RepID=UPI002E2EEEA1|nr:glycoside hydrolase family 3 protein [Longimicrobium sp.]HEX6037280.1 glycoside hydrolase family 3 protein [Longimicrobium sp.]